MIALDYDNYDFSGADWRLSRPDMLRIWYDKLIKWSVRSLLIYHHISLPVDHQLSLPDSHQLSLPVGHQVNLLVRY